MCCVNRNEVQRLYAPCEHIEFLVFRFYVIINFLHNVSKKLFIVVFFFKFNHHHKDLNIACQGVNYFVV